MFDVLNRFIFEENDVRGELVQLDNSVKQILDGHHYPNCVSELLGQLLAATSLLTAMLKFEGDITVQFQGDGALKFASINGNNLQQMRGTAKISANDGYNQSEVEGRLAELEQWTISDLFGKGTMMVTVKPVDQEPYQGVVELLPSSVSDCFNEYFNRSEQLETQMYLFASAQEHRAAGMLLQALPERAEKKQQDGTVKLAVERPLTTSEEQFQHLHQLAATLTATEAFSLPAQDILYRLFHQDELRVFEPQPVSFVCGCSLEKCYGAIAHIPNDELLQQVNQQGKFAITCQYCLTEYLLDIPHSLQ